MQFEVDNLCDVSVLNDGESQVCSVCGDRQLLSLRAMFQMDVMDDDRKHIQVLKQAHCDFQLSRSEIQQKLGLETLWMITQSVQLFVYVTGAHLLLLQVTNLSINPRPLGERKKIFLILVIICLFKASLCKFHTKTPLF